MCVADREDKNTAGAGVETLHCIVSFNTDRTVVKHAAGHGQSKSKSRQTTQEAMLLALR